MRGKITEKEEQKAVVKWFRCQYRKYWRCLIAIPNGAFLAGDMQARVRQAASLKAQGLVPGVSDLFLAIPKKEFHGLWIEMKTPKGRGTVEQVEFSSLMAELGYAAFICKGQESAIETIKKYMEHHE